MIIDQYSYSEILYEYRPWTRMYGLHCEMRWGGVDDWTHTSLAVGATDLDGRQIVQKLLELWVSEGGPPGVVCAVVEPDRKKKNS